METVAQRLLRSVVKPGLCTGCGACVALDPAGRAEMRDTPFGPVPDIAGSDLPELAWRACPGKGIRYPELYRAHYGSAPDNWLTGHLHGVRTGYSGDPRIRSAGASGGVLTHVLTHLLESGRIDAAIVVQQGVPEPEKARAIIVDNADAIQAAAQSVYVPVSVLDVLRRLEPGRRYAITCLPDQSAALRVLQSAGFAPAQQIRFVVGPYTGTALYPDALRCFLRSKGIPDSEPVTSLKWRAGEWPGHLEIKTASGKVFRSKKVYYNFLIPFFVTQNSLQNMDFANEFADLAVGDAWSPKFESLGGGHSVIATRTEEMESIIAEMESSSRLIATREDPLKASEMHGHMIDFKRRGGYIRNRLRRFFGFPAADFGMRPDPLPASRWAVELVVSGIFLLSRTWLARQIVELIPESVIGPLFNHLRLGWKNISKPTKRKGLGNLRMVETAP